MLGDRDIVFLSSLEWDQLWQGHQELASRLAAAGNRVLYVENIGVRAPRWHDRSRVVSRLQRWSHGVVTGGAREVAHGLWVTAPLLLPPFGRARRAVNRQVLLPAVARTMRRLGMLDPIVWTYLPTDSAVDLISRLRSPRSPVVYSCLADFTQLVSDAGALARCERKLMATCDLVFALPGLVEHCEQHSRRVVRLTPAVSTELFDPAKAPPPPAALAGVRRPVVGYMGGLHRHVDLELLDALALKRPDWTWAFVGPLQVPVGRLGERPNVRLLGAVAHTELPGAVAAFDVGIVPYDVNAYTDSVMPTKIGEYLAMGKPVVSTPIPGAVALERSTDGLVVTAPACPDEFVSVLERAMALAVDDRVAARCRALAETWAWSRRIDEMSAALVATADSL